jgi:prepilin-type N-terminal cleavage/methylation domain-containing protein
MQKPFPRYPVNQSGFTLIELMMATLVLLVGIVAVAQLVPLAVSLNASNRQNSTALVIAQRELNQMAAQSLSLSIFTDDLNNLCSLGNPASPGQLVGSAVKVDSNRPLIDFTVAPQTGYSFNYVDPNDPFQLTYDVRWAVVTFVNSGGAVSGKRFVLGVRRQGGQPVLPVTLDTLVEK